MFFPTKSMGVHQISPRQSGEGPDSQHAARRHRSTTSPAAEPGNDHGISWEAKTWGCFCILGWQWDGHGIITDLWLAACWWLVAMNFLFSHINIGFRWSFQLTNSIIFQKGGEKPTTSLGWMGWYWDKRYHFLGLVGPQWMALAVGFTSLTFVNFDPGSRVRPQQRCFFQILKVTSYWNYDDQVFIFLGWVTFW